MNEPQKYYLVRKKANTTPTCEDDWIVMTTAEFAVFKRSEDGQSRKNNFTRIDAYKSYDTIFVECDPQDAKIQEAARQRALYGEKQIIEIDYEDGCIAGANNFDMNPEQKFFDQLTIKALYEGIAELTHIERSIIVSLFLSDSKSTLEQYAKANGVSTSCAGAAKLRALRKLKKFLENQGFGC